MIGKISRDFFEENIINRIGAVRKEVVMPPKNGVDVGIVKIGNKFMAVTTDPLYIDTSFGFEKAAWFALHILLSDLYTSGIPAEYMSIDLNLPLKITDNEFKEIWDVINSECIKYNIEVVTGHTARYANTEFPMVGGVTLMGIGDQYITTQNAGVGDKIIMTKSCGLEASIILANTFPEYVRKNIGKEYFNSIIDKFYSMTCVNEEQLAIKYGIVNKVTSMHDATEGGLLNSIYEIGSASENGLIVDYDKIIIDSDIEKLCSLFHIDPLRSISEGTLLITVKNECADEFISILNKSGIHAAIIGEILEQSHGIKIKKAGNTELILPEKDQFWDAVGDGIKRGLK
ncbi:AIR synthase family protein [Ferroplasma sp.]|uniref:AIR synthase family protein n=1 Tax=Ferroplasma sp. TaxID=2591003 RepID=UPI00307CF19B